MSDNLVRTLEEHEAEHVFGGTSLCDDPLISCDDEEDEDRVLPKAEFREDPLP